MKNYPSCITGDCFYIISKFLHPIDIINVSKAYPNHRIDMNLLFLNSIKKNIDNWFRCYFGNKYDTFRKIMIDSKAVLSGSFIIQMILNENWIGSDIDIFISKSDCDLVHGVIKSPLENFLYQDHIYNHGDETRRNLYCNIFKNANSRIRDYKCNDNLLDIFKFSYFQIISCRNDLIKDLIIKNVDFDICKNMFWYDDYDDEGCNIFIYNHKHITDKKFTGHTSYNSSDKNSNDRQIKYEKRGFVHIK